MTCEMRNLGNSRLTSGLSALSQGKFPGFLVYRWTSYVDRTGESRVRLGSIPHETEELRANSHASLSKLAHAEFA
jgi:hypothetical protein